MAAERAFLASTAVLLGMLALGLEMSMLMGSVDSILVGVGWTASGILWAASSRSLAIPEGPLGALEGLSSDSDFCLQKDKISHCFDTATFLYLHIRVARV